MKIINTEKSLIKIWTNDIEQEAEVERVKFFLKQLYQIMDRYDFYNLPEEIQSFLNKNKFMEKHDPILSVVKKIIKDATTFRVYAPFLTRSRKRQLADDIYSRSEMLLEFAR